MGERTSRSRLALALVLAILLILVIIAVVEAEQQQPQQQESEHRPKQQHHSDPRRQRLEHLTKPPPSPPTSATFPSVIVPTQNGPIRGFLDSEHGLSVFLGVPFAKPPIGPLRWQSPQPISSFSSFLKNKHNQNSNNNDDHTLFDAIQFPPGCPQKCVLPDPLCPAVVSEDCLYLNIWAPRSQKQEDEKQKLMPVMVFFAGGAFEEGSGSSYLYDGTFLANVTGTVVITFSYRLGALGFLVLPQQQQSNSDFDPASTTTTTGSPSSSSSFSALLGGNYGFEDQRLALRWIKNNVAQFGGDPNRVTLFGQSAGATSIAMHLMSPLSDDLFQQAIVQSSPWALPFKTNSDASRFGSTFASKIGCQKLSGQKLVDCLLSKSMEQVLDAQYKTSRLPNPLNYSLDVMLTWTPTIDGVNVDMQPMKAFASGAYRKVPLMIGSTKDEGIMFIYSAWNHTLLEIEYLAALAVLFKSSSPAVSRMYPPSGPFRDSRPVLSQLFTDYLFTCPARQVANWTSSHGNNDVHFYAFDWVISFDQDVWGPRYRYCIDKVCHGEELVYVFNSAATLNYNFTSDESRLSCSMMSMWGSFAHTGNPNSMKFSDCTPQSPVSWPNFETKTHQDLKITAPESFVEDRLATAKLCDFWDGLGYRF